MFRLRRLKVRLGFFSLRAKTARVGVPSSGVQRHDQVVWGVGGGG